MAYEIFKRFYKRIVEYKKKHPELSNAEIGRRHGISRERVRQILRDYGNAY